MNIEKFSEKVKAYILEKGENILVAAAARKWKNSSISRENN